jgi:flagellar motility protein MotE (MotC chaperone)
MGKIINILSAVIAYFCVGTVITLALILGYMWRTDRLNDEKVFRIFALMHDVDLHQIAQSQHKDTDEVPPEEPSTNETLHDQQVQDRNFEVKLLALQRGRQDYDHSRQELQKEIDRYDRLAQDWQSKLKQQEELTNQENVAKVVSQLEQVRPDVGKAELMRWIKEGRMDDAIVLMSKMSETKLGKILKTFETDMELDTLHEIHERIIGGGADSEELEKALDELTSAEEQS